MPNKKIFIIAGEVSGDVLGAGIMAAMPNTDFIGIGGENMQKAGLKTLFPISDLAVMGAIEVLRNVKTLTKRIKQTANAIINEKPDIVLTIDSPGFATRVIKQVRKSKTGKNLIQNGLRFHHVVAPQVWAWRPKRAKKYAKLFDKLYSFFDFEIPYFTKYGLDTVAVGHPLAENLINTNNTTKSDEKIMALIPGSRMSEVKRLLPIMHQLVGILSSSGYKYKYAVPTVETTDEYIREQIKSWSVQPDIISSDNRYDLYSKTYFAIAASGTVSAELAMMHIPAIIIYRMNPITTWLIRQMISVKWVSLVNILLNRRVYPELLGTDATAENIFAVLGHVIIPSNYEKMIAELKRADPLWCHKNTSAYKLIANDLLK